MSVATLLTEAASRFSPWKLSCRLCATTNVVLAGEQEIDDVQGSENNRILLTGQDEAKENGPWLMKRSGWERPADYADTVPNALGVNLLVTEGTDNTGEWRMTSPTVGEVTPGLVATTWTKIGGLASSAIPNPWNPTSQVINDTAGLAIGAAGNLELQGLNVAVQAAGGGVEIVGANIELTGTVTNNGSPIGGGSGPALSDATPEAPTTAGTAGVAATASRGDHAHPRQTTLGVAAGETPSVGNSTGATTIAGSTITEEATTITRGPDTTSGGREVLDVGGVTNALRRRAYDAANALARTVTEVAAGVVDTVVGTYSMVIGSTTRTQTASALVRIDQTPTGPLYTQASSATGAQTNAGQTRLYAAADGTRFDWCYDGTVGLGMQVNPAGTCGIEVAAGVTSFDVLKGGVRRLRITANGIAGALATASGPESFAHGDATTVASGDRSWASGYNCQTTKTYGVTMGANNANIGTAAVCIGENLSNSNDSANCSQIGFQQTIGTNSLYSSAIGCYVNIGNNCTGAFACGLSAAIPDGRPGQFQHSSGCEGFAGTGWIDMMRLCTAAPAALQNREGGAFFPEAYSFGLYTIEVLGCTDDAAKMAHAIYRVPVKCAVSDLTLGSITTVESTMAAAGWSVTITEEAAGELRITCDPGTDTVRFGARVSWPRIGATYNIA